MGTWEAASTRIGLHREMRWVQQVSDSWGNRQLAISIAFLSVSTAVCLNEQPHSLIAS